MVAWAKASGLSSPVERANRRACIHQGSMKSREMWLSGRAKRVFDEGVDEKRRYAAASSEVRRMDA